MNKQPEHTPIQLQTIDMQKIPAWLHSIIYTLLVMIAAHGSVEAAPTQSELEEVCTMFEALSDTYQVVYEHDTVSISWQMNADTEQMVETGCSTLTGLIPDFISGVDTTQSGCVYNEEQRMAHCVSESYEPQTLTLYTESFELPDVPEKYGVLFVQSGPGIGDVIENFELNFTEGARPDTEHKFFFPVVRNGAGTSQDYLNK